MREHRASAPHRVRRFTELIAELIKQIAFVAPGCDNVAVGETLSDGEFGAEDENGLSSEFQLVSERARDPNPSAQERADATMMTFGTHRE